MKNNSIWKIIWVIGVYAILIVVLYLVVMYKVKWEDMDLNKYLYFYNCSNTLCTSSEKQIDYHSKILCEDDICPHIKEINGSNLILANNSSSFIFNYVTGEIVNDKYVNYKFLNNNNYIVTSNDKLQGIININGDLLIDLKYDLIKDYKNGMVSYCNNNGCGIDTYDENIKLENMYDDVILINKSLFGYKNDNNYYIGKFSDGKNVNNVTYDFMYSFDNFVFVIYNNTIDILDENLNSLLLMKIKTHYKYGVEKERNSLNLFSDSKYLVFTLVNEDNSKTEYKFDIKNKKFV